MLSLGSVNTETDGARDQLGCRVAFGLASLWPELRSISLLGQLKVSDGRRILQHLQTGDGFVKVGHVMLKAPRSPINFVLVAIMSPYLALLEGSEASQTLFCRFREKRLPVSEGKKKKERKKKKRTGKKKKKKRREEKVTDLSLSHPFFVLGFPFPLPLPLLTV